MGKRSPGRMLKRRLNNCARKIKHPTADAAQMALAEVAMRGKLYAPDTTIYQCDLCGSYHWASHDPSPQQQEMK